MNGLDFKKEKLKILLQKVKDINEIEFDSLIDKLIVIYANRFEQWKTDVLNNIQSPFPELTINEIELALKHCSFHFAGGNNVCIVCPCKCKCQNCEYII